MAKKLVANSSCTLAHDTSAIPPSVVTVGAFVITSTPSITVKAEGGGVHKGSIAFTFSGGNAPGCTPATVTGSGTISPSAIKSKADGSLVMRVDDIGTGTFVGTTPNLVPPFIPPVIPVPLGSQPVTIATAGQTKVLSE